MAKVYVSYSQRDRDLVTKVAERLKMQGHELSLAIERLPPGKDWRRALSENLKSSEVFVVFLSRSSVESQFVLSEIGAARVYAVESDRMLMIPVIIDDIEVPKLVQDIQAVIVPDRNIDEIVGRISSAISGFTTQIGSEKNLPQQEAPESASDMRGAAQKAATVAGSEPSEDAPGPDKTHLKELFDLFSRIAAPDEAAQLIDSANLATAYAETAGGPVDNLLLFASLLLAPRRGEQQEESWFVLFHAIEKLRTNKDATPKELQPGETLGLSPQWSELWEKADQTRIRGDVNVRKEVFGTIREASDLARHVSPPGNKVPDPPMRVRHLLAALIWGDAPRVRLHLENLGVDLFELGGEFHEGLRHVAGAKNESASAWSQVLLPPSDPRRPAEVESRVAETPETSQSASPPPPSRPREPWAVLPIIEGTGRGSAPPYLQFAGFAPDSADGRDDLLDIEQDVNAICAILAARDVPLPLSLGLFGDWGSGKTFFMNMMHERIKLLADSSKDKSHAETAYCDKVVQIRFNAWHYIDANLWASLVTHILDELYAAMMGQKDDPWNIAVKNLEQAQGLHEEAKHALDQAKVSVTEAGKTLESTRNARVTREREIDERFNALKRVLQDRSKAELQKILADLGVNTSISTINELAGEIGDLRTRGLHLAGSLAIMAQSKHAIPYFAALLVILLLPVGIGYMLPQITGQTGFVAEVGTFIGQIGAVVAGVGAWLRHPLKWIGKGIRSLEEIQQAAEAERQKMVSQETVKPEAELAILREKETAARENVRIAEKRLHEAELMLKESQPSRRLYRLIEERAQAADYRSSLGIISLIRNDFERLSELIRPLSSKPGDAAGGSTGGASTAGPSPDPLPVDRIILYIDDLDRCPADRVVQVLEAVHLLLAFPIFVVVVAVDPRWLRRSLELTHPHLLTAFADEAKPDGAVPSTRAATPQNYLEKIFQVPFHLRPMGRVGYQKLIQDLVQKPGGDDRQSKARRVALEESGKARGNEGAARGQNSAAASVAAPDEIAQTLPVGSANTARRTVKPAAARAGVAEDIERKTHETAGVNRSASRTADTAGKESLDAAEQTEEVDVAKGPHASVPPVKARGDTLAGDARGEGQKLDLTPPALALSSHEMKFMEKLNLMFSTPRAVKRFVNTYRIFRVRAPGSDTTAFTGSYSRAGEFRCAMTLLAILTGFPSLAPKALRILFRQPKDATWEDIVTAFKASEVHEHDFLTDELAPTAREGRAEWLRMCEAVTVIGENDGLPFAAGTFINWTPWVARYSFSSVLPAYREAE